MTVEYAVDYEGHTYLTCECNPDNKVSFLREMEQITNALCKQVFIMACGSSPQYLARDEAYQYVKAHSIHYMHCTKWLRPTIYLFGYENHHEVLPVLSRAWLLFDRVKFMSGDDISWKRFDEKQVSKHGFYDDFYYGRGYWITCYKGESDYDLCIYSNDLDTIYQKMNS